MKYLMTLLVLLLLGSTTAAQKKELLEEKETILARAAQVLDAEMRAGRSLHAAVVKEDLIGRYVLQVSIRDKGDISSVFVVSAEGHDTRSQNRFKDLVHFTELPFKMPKGRHYRLEHTFDLNAIAR
jgi:heme exporter protein D